MSQVYQRQINITVELASEDATELVLRGELVDHGPTGKTRHHMALEVVVDRNDLTIRAVNEGMPHSPFDACHTTIPALDGLVGSLVGSRAGACSAAGGLTGAILWTPPWR